MKVWKSIAQSGNGVVVAVASRDRGKAEVFIRDAQAEAPFPEAPRAFGSYEELLADPGVDAVYVPLPTGLRKPWVEAAARAGKHIVCEKPCARTLAGLESILQECERAKVQFMDGVMFMHGARLPQMRAVLDDGESVGELRRVSTTFCFQGNPEFLASDIRLDSELEPFGSLGDLGWYCIRFILWAAKWQRPNIVAGRLLRSAKREASPGEVPLSFSGEMIYDGWSGSFYSSFEAALQQWAHVDGSKGNLRCDDFVVSATGERARFWKGKNEMVTDQEGDPSPKGQSCNLYRTFANLVLSGKVDPFWPEISWKTQSVLEAARHGALLGQDVTLP